MAFVLSSPCLIGARHTSSPLHTARRRHHTTVCSRRQGCPATMTQSNADQVPDDSSFEEEIARIEGMRSRLQGLFGQDDSEVEKISKENFDGTSLRKAIVNRWGVQYDIQPAKFHNRVYVQIMWRYFEQQSFYMDEDEFSSHCEAMSILLKRWDAVDYFLDYISNIKKKPVVGITINIPIPNLDASKTPFEV